MLKVLEALLVIVLAWVVAGLLWQLAGTSKAVRLAPAATPPRAAEVNWTRALDWFGHAAPVQTQASTFNAQLVAVFAGNDKESVAIFSGLQANNVAVKVGEELQPGVKLVRVASEVAVIERNGSREEIPLLRNGAPVAGLVASGGIPVPAAAVPGVEPPADGPANNVTRGQMAAAMQSVNIADWSKGLSLAKDGGLQIDNVAQQPFARTLQLQQGDVMKSVNGKPLTQLSEISFLYTVFSQQSQVTLVIQRHDNPLSLKYQIQP
ncbi:general secretion pathway protein C [Andreprevotia lacus DSM 23236]|jgi:type II secretory pathway component PulC|uniref:General secretion pathway protein C n=1 Tax=Andreprevotia lacus DSM 23236 TaxID=1121001 RepID=A0A1W1XPT3_9NEIS|nr:type II secretion system protein N [Andreprevotia lacus]SMC25887.1 general secretion pathway protein C [Andreprevotia lacus DSM 23236]